jgi:hypothetical protein
MRHHRPDAPELLRTVATYLGGLKARVDDGERYNLIVCEHILTLVVRELEAEPMADADEAALVGAIRSGACDSDWEQTLAQVLQRTIARLEVVRPEHLAPEHRS